MKDGCCVTLRGKKQSVLLSKQTLKNSFCLKTKQINKVVVNNNVTPLNICTQEKCAGGSCAAPESCAKNDVAVVKKLAMHDILRFPGSEAGTKSHHNKIVFSII